VGEPLAADEHRRLGVAAVVDVERISDICLSLHPLSSDFLVCPVKFADSLPDPLVNIIGGALNLIRRHYPDAVHASLVIDRGDRDGLPPVVIPVFTAELCVRGRRCRHCGTGFAGVKEYPVELADGGGLEFAYPHVGCGAPAADHPE